MFRWIAIAAAIALVASVAYGQSSNGSDPTLPLGQVRPMGQPGMMGMHDGSMPPMETMPMGMNPGPMCGSHMSVAGMAGSPASYLEARLAFARAELAITSAQEPAWNAYATTLRALEVPKGMYMDGARSAMMSGGSFLDRMDARISHLDRRLAALKAARDPVAALYQQLDAAQKQKADMVLPMSLCM